MTGPDTNALMRLIPAMDELLNTPWAIEFSTCLGRDYVKDKLAEILDGLRRDINNGTHFEAPLSEIAADRSMVLFNNRLSSTLRPVVNATGVVIHTNLGRAPLALEALKAVNDIAGAYSTLEYNPEKNERGERNSHIEWLLCHLTGADAALVVNNNAAAVLLALAATSAGAEVIISNGELVEIGASFRIPDILSFSGAVMVAVGCTNAVRISDYRNAITDHSAALLKVHPSNYRIEGFVESVSREELAELASSRGLVFIEDLGSGLLCPLGLPFAHLEHSVRDCLEAGVEIVTFSGDKLLGGPQIGVIAGSRRLIDKMRCHQLLRALRVDKMALAAFEATLRIYLAGRQSEIPVIKMIEMDEDALLKKARRLCGLLKQAARGTDGLTIELIKTDDAVGGGAFPAKALPGFGVGIRSANSSAENIALAFRTAAVPVIPGIRDGQVVLHVRTLLDGDEGRIASAFAAVIGAGAP